MAADSLPSADGCLLYSGPGSDRASSWDMCASRLLRVLRDLVRGRGRIHEAKTEPHSHVSEPSALLSSTVKERLAELTRTSLCIMTLAFLSVENYSPINGRLSHSLRTEGRGTI